MTLKIGKIFKLGDIKSQIGLAQIPLMIGLLIMAIAIPVATKLSEQNADTRNLAREIECASNSDCGTNYKCVNYSCVYVTPTPKPPSSSVKCTSNKCSGDKIIYCRSDGTYSAAMACNYPNFVCRTGKCVNLSTATSAPKPTATPACVSKGGSCASGSPCCSGLYCASSRTCQPYATSTPKPSANCGTEGQACCDAYMYGCVCNNGLINIGGICKKPTATATKTPTPMQACVSKGGSCAAVGSKCCSGFYCASSRTCQPYATSTPLPFSGKDGLVCSTATNIYNSTPCSKCEHGYYKLNYTDTSYICGKNPDKCRDSSGLYYKINVPDGCNCSISASCASGACANGKCVPKATSCFLTGYNIWIANGQTICKDGGVGVGAYSHTCKSGTLSSTRCTGGCSTCVAPTTVIPKATATPIQKCECINGKYQGSGCSSYLYGQSCTSPTAFPSGCPCINGKRTGSGCSSFEYGQSCTSPTVKPVPSGGVVTKAPSGAVATKPPSSGTCSGTGADICNTDKLSVRAVCVSGKWDYDEQLCGSTNACNRTEVCSGRTYYCGKDGKWSTSNDSCASSNNCKQCPTDFGCYKNGNEYRWFVSGYTQGGFSKVADTECTNNGVGKPAYLGKQKGDANCDGRIDAAGDYSLWYKEFYDGNLGSIVKNSWNADFTGPNGTCDGKVTVDDYALWYKFFYDLNIGN